MKVGIKTQGSANKTGDGIKDKQWTLEIAIPWTDIPTVKGPPKMVRLSMNFYRVDVRTGGKGRCMGTGLPLVMTSQHKPFRYRSFYQAQECATSST